MYRTFAFLLVLFGTIPLSAQEIDVQHYRFELELSDHSDAIQGKATITFKTLADGSQIKFDLASPEGEKGMYAFQVKEGGQLLPANQGGDRLTVQLAAPVRKGEVHTYEVHYMGIPKNGLIISQNRHGDRTFFADNWPNRAHHWIPCNDRPDDKASFEFLVKAPAHYRVISNGLLVEEKELGSSLRLTHWKEEASLSTKVMVIGAARFAVKKYADSPKEVPVSAWVYPQDSARGFYDYGVAPGILRYFSDYIAPFPFKKLANVQSTTIFGGMENASAIFYAEESVTGDRKSEGLVAHEVAHQWFGDAASEKSFAHLWLSEGFATYLTDMYVAHRWGTDSAVRRLQKEREQVVQFARTNRRPVVDSLSELMELLNANSYQKGAWVLHMLRTETGDSLFQKIIQTYYHAFKGGNAETADFKAIAEKVTGRDLGLFFHQWLYTPGIPRLAVGWKADGREVKIEIRQEGEKIFQVPLELLITTSNGGRREEKVFLSGRETSLKIELDAKAVSLGLDPHTRLLFEAKVVQQ